MLKGTAPHLWALLWSVVGSAIFTWIVTWYQGVLRAQEAAGVHLDPISSFVAGMPPILVLFLILAIAFSFFVIAARMASRKDTIPSAVQTDSSEAARLGDATNRRELDKARRGRESALLQLDVFNRDRIEAERKLSEAERKIADLEAGRPSQPYVPQESKRDPLDLRRMFGLDGPESTIQGIAGRETADSRRTPLLEAAAANQREQEANRQRDTFQRVLAETESRLANSETNLGLIANLRDELVKENAALKAQIEHPRFAIRVVRVVQDYHEIGSGPRIFAQVEVASLAFASPARNWIMAVMAPSRVEGTFEECPCGREYLRESHLQSPKRGSNVRTATFFAAHDRASDLRHKLGDTKMARGDVVTGFLIAVFPGITKNLTTDALRGVTIRCTDFEGTFHVSQMDGVEIIADGILEWDR